VKAYAAAAGLVAMVPGCRAAPPPVPQSAVVQGLLERVASAEPEPEPGGTVAAGVATVEGVERAAIVFQGPARLRFPWQRIPPGAYLRFGVGLADGCGDVPQGSHARFRVAMETKSAGDTEIWSEVVASRGAWHDVEVELAPHAGRDAEIVLGVDSPEGPGACRPAWSRPILVSPGPVRVPRAPVRYLSADLLGQDRPPIDLGSFVAYGRVLEGPVPDAHGRERRGSAHGAPLETRFDVPPHAILRLAGELLRAPRAGFRRDEVVGFEARLDGTPVFTRSVRAGAAPLTFTRELDLSSRAGERVSLSLAVSGAGPSTIAWWTQALLFEARDAPAAPASASNVLLIVVDTLRADHVGLYGARSPTTPNLDRFAADARVFDAAITSASWTQPAVASILTGLTPIEHGVVGTVPLDPAIETLAEVGQRAGLATLAVSANPILGRREGFDRGFGSFVELPWARADAVTNVFTDWLSAHAQEPWLAYLHYIDPHDEYDPPAPYSAMFTAGYVAPPPEKTRWFHEMNFGRRGVVLSASEMDYLRGAYDGEIRYWDAAFGRVLAALRSRGLLEHTVVAVVGDHGEEFLEHGKLFHGFHLYEESVRVPLVVRAPGVIPPGRDPHVFETRRLKELLAAAGRGTDLAPLLKERGPAFSHTTTGFSRNRYETLASLRDAEWKYVFRLDDGRVELYHLPDDPREVHDIAGQRPDVLARFAPIMRGELTRRRPGASTWTDTGLVERLKAAGYLQ
jgi:arylsulfatase A-like enzyme